MSHVLAGKVAVVAGASKGLGREIAVQLAGLGAQVALLARSKAALDQIVQEIGADAALALPCDLRSGQAIRAAIDAAAERFGGVDVLICNAVLCLLHPIETVSEEDARAELETNLLAPILLARAAVPHMLARGGGHIINVSSESVTTPMPYLTLYAATKAGLENLSQGLRVELAPKGVRVGVFRSGYMRETSSAALWSEEDRAGFYAALKETGLDHFTGGAIPIPAQAGALISMLTLPPQANVDHMTVRSAR